jgi:hypothetical protein
MATRRWARPGTPAAGRTTTSSRSTPHATFRTTAALCAAACLTWLAWPATAESAGKALSFDGVNDAATVADADVFSPPVNDLSISVWALAPASSDGLGNGGCGSSGQYVVVKGWTDVWEWGLEFDRNAKVCFSTWQLNSNTHGGVSVDRTINDGQWHHYAVTLDYKAALVLYIDGAEVARRTSFSKDMGNGPQPVYVGARTDGNRFEGRLDELRIVTRALTAAEVGAEYNAGAGRYGTADSDLAAGWHFDEGSGTTTADYSGNGRAAALTGGVAWVDGLIAPPGGDITPPMLSGLGSSSITTSSATITWATNEAATSRVEYGTTTTYETGARFSTLLVTTHSQTLTSLTAGTLYHYRVRSADAAGNESTSADATFTTTAASDTTPPTGTVTINGGAATTASTSVTLTLSATDNSGTVSQMQFSSDGTTYSAWEVYATSKAWTLFSGDGEKSVYAKFRDAAGNVSAAATDSITLSTAPPPTDELAFEELGGQVVMEAEHFDGRTPRNGKDWVVETSRDGHAGDGYVVALPNSGVNQNTGYVTGSPELTYRVRFTTPGTYEVWARGYGATDADDSVHAGLDGASPSTADRLTGFWASEWIWSRNTMDGAPASVVVPTAGLHTVHLWMREDGTLIDKLLLTTNGSLPTPSGPGPAESARVPVDGSDGDTTPPAGTITINGAAAATKTAAVTLTLSATDNSGAISQMQVSNDGTAYSAPEAYATSKSWTLSAGDGAKTVSAKFKDAAGNWSAAISDGITLDTTAPTISGVSHGTPAATSTTITWTTSEAATSQVEHGPTASYGALTPIDATLRTSHSVALSGLTAATTYYYRARSSDAAGNERLGSQGTFTTAAAPPSTTTTVTFRRGASPTTSYTQMYEAEILPTATSTTKGNADVLYLNYQSRRLAAYFDVSSIPNGATVTSALLKYYFYNGAGLNAPVGVYRLRTNWLGGAAWTTPGGDWADATGVNQGSSPYATQTVSANWSWVTWDVTSLVQQWVSGAQPNVGALLKVTTSTTAWCNAYGSARAATGDRPSLTVTYTAVGPPTVTVQVAPARRLYPGQQATITATGTGSGTGLEYQFLLDGTVLRDWAASNSATWSPTLSSLGTRTLEVRARDTNGTGSGTTTLHVIHQPLRPQ